MFRKKSVFRIALIVSIIFLFSCKRSESQPSKDDSDVDGNNSDESQPIQQENPCDNIFYPLSINNQWIYQARLDNENEPAEIRELKLSVVGIDDASADIELLDQPTSLITKSTANCDNGSITNFPVTEVDMGIGEVSVDLSLEYIDGILMPSQADFEAENWAKTWETSYTASGSLQGSFENKPITIALSSSPVTMSWQVLGTSYDIEVPAGKFSDVVLMSGRISLDVTSLVFIM